MVRIYFWGVDGLQAVRPVPASRVEMMTDRDY
jgi:hypothetical protein